MTISNSKVNMFIPVPPILLCVSSIMSAAINNAPAGAMSNAERFGNVDFAITNVEGLAEKHIYYYKGT